MVFDGGHEKDNFLTTFDHDNEKYIAEYKKQFGVEPPISFPKGKYEEGIQIAVNNALNDINSIKAMNSPFVDTLIDVYIDTLSMERVENKNAELTEAHSKAKFVEAPVSESEQPADEIRNQVSLTSSTDGSNMIRVYATKSQLVQITDFMKAIGVTYEIV